MSKKIILYHPKTHHEKNYRFFWIPYSILSVAAPLIDGGYDVEIWDNNLNERTDYRKKLSSVLEDTICIGVSSMIGHQITCGLRFSKQVKEINSKIPIAWGGALSTLVPETTLKNKFIDFIVRGQGESGFLGLIHYLEGKQKSIPKNVGYKNNGKINEGENTVFEDKNTFPRYPFKIINIKRYIRNDPQINTRVLNYVSSQGCPFGCGFCTDTSIYHQKWSALDVDRVIDEVRFLIKGFKLNGIKFYDSNFFVNKKRTIDFARRFSEISVSWAASAHPKNLLDLTSKDFDILRQSNLKRLLIGAESGVQEELNLVKKGIKVKDIEKLADALNKKDIIASFTFIVGYPKMPEENIDITLKFAERLATEYKNHEFKIHIYLPFPGTPLYELAKNCGFSPPSTLEDWSRLDYYEKQTPWISSEHETDVRIFNETYCPYVS